MPMRHVAIVLGIAGFWAGLTAPAVAHAPGTLGFVIRDWFTAIHESKFMDECPEGLNIGNDEFWWRSQPKDLRARITGNGLERASRRYWEVMGRGPNGEDICMNPTLIKDPPLRVAEGKIGYGDNLDGTTDGHATAKTCKHDKYTSPDGKTGIDNQMARLVGCTFGWRKSGMVELHANEERGTAGHGMASLGRAG